MHHADLDALERDPSKFKATMPKWIWSHNPVEYAVKNYRSALESVEKGMPFENTNLPPGYKYEPWTIASETEKESMGQMTTLRNTGDWS